MHYYQAGPDKSVSALGTGFRYNYRFIDRSIDISDALENKRLVRLKFENHVASNPLSYIDYLDKANKIQALALSNNKTTNLASTLSDNRIIEILKSTAQTSLCAQTLSQNNFKAFSKLFSDATHLRMLRIKKVTSRRDSYGFYSARLQTVNNHSISVHSCNLPQLMQFLSEQTMHDLIIRESENQSIAHNLLKASTKFKILSCVLDKQFNPENMLKTHSAYIGEMVEAS